MHGHTDRPYGRRRHGKTRAACGLPLFAAALSAVALGCGNPSDDPASTSEPPPVAGAECSRPSSAWIWCDDFETDRLASYFEFDRANGGFTRVAGVGVGDSYGMRATFQPRVSGAGSLKLAFGATPDPAMRPVDAGSQKYRELFWRMFVRTQPGWSGSGADKLSRAIVMATRAWGEAAIGHVWSAGDEKPFLAIDPVRGTDAAGTLRTTSYNDFDNFTWLGFKAGSTPLFATASANRWFCVEAHMKLNDAGAANGVFELWVDGNLEARHTTLNWLGSYSAYGINAVFFENYWNAGSPVTQSRFFDDIVVSRERIGCGA